MCSQTEGGLREPGRKFKEAFTLREVESPGEKEENAEGRERRNLGWDSSHHFQRGVLLRSARGENEGIVHCWSPENPNDLCV